MAAAAAADVPSDRLSDLPDDLLIHILSFAPPHEAARTTALARRWRRSLWRETAAANLDYRSCSGVYDKALFCAYSRGRVIKKMNISMRGRDITDADLSPVGDAGVEELRLECQDGGCPRYTYAGPSPESLWFDINLSLESLPWASLRVLDLTGCNIPPFPPAEVPDWEYLRYSYMPWHEEPQQQQDMAYDSPPAPPPPRIAFPCLEALRLRRCAMYLDTLQTMIEGAPRLTNLCLESLSVLQHCMGQLQICFHLRCPAVAVLVMANLHVHHGMAMSGIRGCSVKLDAPCLRTLRYTQSMCSDTALSFDSPMPYLERVHIAMHSAGSASLRRSLLTPNVSHIRFLKFTAYSIADLADDDGGSPMILPNLERLEIEELTSCLCPASCHAAAAALMSLLHCCPVLSELWLKFSWLDYLHKTVQDPVIQAAVVSDFTPCGSVNSDDDEDCCEGLDLLPELNYCCRLDCLQSSLRRVVLEFETEELTCFQIQLLKFLACYAVVAEEVVINGGKGYDSSSIGQKVARWRRDSHNRHLAGKEGDHSVCYHCCEVAGMLSSSSPPSPLSLSATAPSLWTPSMCEFPHVTMHANSGQYGE